MSKKLDRHRARTQKLNRAREQAVSEEFATIAPSGESRATGLRARLPFSSPDLFDALATATAPIEVDFSAIDGLVMAINAAWDEQRREEMIEGCERQVLQSILIPFGLGQLLGAMDKDGGNISTPHNAQRTLQHPEGLFANEADRARFNTPYKGQKSNRAARKRLMQETAASGRPLIDEYTGNVLPVDERGRPDGRTQLDHVVSRAEIHGGRPDDPVTGAYDFLGYLGRLSMDEKERSALADHPDNHAWTNSRLNQSKGDNPALVWLGLSKNGQSNAERFDAVPELVESKDRKARSHVLKERSKSAGKKYASDVAYTGAGEAAKMGFQQAFGLLLAEVFAACIAEIKDAYSLGLRNSLHGDGFFKDLKRRLGRVTKRVASKWQAVAESFGAGAVSGFISNIVTAIINFFMTTSRRMVRIIREGFFAIVKALKTLIWPEPGTTPDQRYDAALKAIVMGAFTGLGIVAEEAIEKFVVTSLMTTFPPLAPAAGFISGVVAGAMVGLASVLVVYALDQLDIFGVQGDQRYARIMDELDRLIAVSEKRVEELNEETLNPIRAMRRAYRQTGLAPS